MKEITPKKQYTLKLELLKKKKTIRAGKALVLLSKYINEQAENHSGICLSFKWQNQM